MTDDHDDTGLEDLFAEALRSPPVPSQDFLARVISDAGAQQPLTLPGWRLWLGALGGLPGLAGLATAACVGVWIGIAPPAGLPDIAAGLLGADLLSDSMDQSPGLSGFGWEIEEG